LRDKKKKGKRKDPTPDRTSSHGRGKGGKDTAPSNGSNKEGTDVLEEEGRLEKTWGNRTSASSTGERGWAFFEEKKGKIASSG